LYGLSKINTIGRLAPIEPISCGHCDEGAARR
jgi:hypothetical protein